MLSAQCSRIARGFSIIELLVSLSIMTVISTVVLANHTRFNSSVLLESLAYEIGLSVRQAQVFGVSVRQSATGFSAGYGVHFSDTSSYLFFVDTNASRAYEEGVDAIVNAYSLSQGHRILAYCGYTAAGVARCSNSDVPITHLDIVFLRPNPDAVMSSNESDLYSRSVITVAAAAGDTRSVEIASTGQISVKNP